MTKKIQVAIYFEPDAWKALQAAARVIAAERNENVTASQVVRLAVDDFLETHPWADKWRKAGKK